MRLKSIYGYATALILLFALASCGIGDVVDDGDSFKDRQHAIDAVYQQGKDSRRSMDKTGIVVNEQSCGNSWTTSGASVENTPKNTTRKNNTAFQERRRLSFINGCMDRPNSLPPITEDVSIPPTPSVSASTPD